jgi:hypothetical protein
MMSCMAAVPVMEALEARGVPCELAAVHAWLQSGRLLVLTQADLFGCYD